MNEVLSQPSEDPTQKNPVLKVLEEEAGKLAFDKEGQHAIFYRENSLTIDKEDAAGNLRQLAKDFEKMGFKGALAALHRDDLNQAQKAELTALGKRLTSIGEKLCSIPQTQDTLQLRKQLAQQRYEKDKNRYIGAIHSHVISAVARALRVQQRGTNIKFSLSVIPPEGRDKINGVYQEALSMAFKSKLGDYDNKPTAQDVLDNVAKALDIPKKEIPELRTPFAPVISNKEKLAENISTFFDNALGKNSEAESND